MSRPRVFPVQHIAELKAFMLTTRILVLGFVVIEWDWIAAALTLIVWVYTTKLFTDYTEGQLLAEFEQIVSRQSSSCESSTEVDTPSD